MRYDRFFLGMPRVTRGRMIFNILMFAAPFIGLWLIGPIGLLIGMSVACIGWIYLFFILGRREGSCAICGRLVLNVGHGNFGVIFRTDAMMRGEIGPGKECQHCGRIYCSYCTNDTLVDMVCICGSKSFRTVGLHYRHFNFL